MRQRSMMTGLDMEQHSQSFVLPPEIPPLNAFPNFEPHSMQEPYDNNNNSMFYGLRQYHHHQRPPTDISPAMSTPSNFYLPYAPFHAQPTHPLAHGSHGVAVGGTYTEQERDAQFMGHGYKRKIGQVIPGSFQYPSAAEVAHCPFPPERAPFSFPHYGSYTQPIDQRSVRNRAGAATLMDPHLSQGHNNFIQGSYLPHPGSIWYDQHLNGNASDGSSSSLWHQPPSVPYMHGNVATSSIDPGNVCFPRHHETSSSRNHTPFCVFFYILLTFKPGWVAQELLALSDHIGTVNTGLSEEDVEGLLKRRTFLSTRINAPSTDLEIDYCTICQENYKNQDKIATLDCRHKYHAECLKKWLVIKNICPVCKSEALVMEKKKE